MRIFHAGPKAGILHFKYLIGIIAKLAGYAETWIVISSGNDANGNSTKFSLPGTIRIITYADTISVLGSKVYRSDICISQSVLHY